LFSTEDWNFVPMSAINFEDFEVVTCCEEVLLTSESTLWGLQSYLSVGTAYNYGEEVYVRGRILIYEVIDVVPEEGMPTTRHRLKNVYGKEQKGPVTSMCHCNGFLLTGMGQKVCLKSFDLYFGSLDFHLAVPRWPTQRRFVLGHALLCTSFGWIP
jgi:cleavage and polyadenylation specificity factor subunit 1